MATKGAGVFFQYGNGSSAFTTIAEVTAVNGANLTRDTFNVTHMGSTWQDVIGGLPDAGEVSIDLNWLPADATHVQMSTDLTGTSRNYRIRWADYGSGTVNFTTDFGVDEQLDATAHGMETGEPFQVTTSSALPGGLAIDTTYYCKRLTANTLTAHASSAGAVAGTGTVDITSDGTGTHTIQMVRSWALPGLITALSPSAPVDGKLAATATFKVSTTPVFT